MRSTPILILSWLVIVAMASWLRLSHLEDRPIHADEATGARIVAERLNGSDYHFDPSHFHGPSLSLIGAWAAKLRGETTWSELSTATLRHTCVYAGILIVLVPLLWRQTLGPLSALISGAFLATSPLLVYYSRVFIHETWLVLFGLLALTFLYRWLIDQRTKDALLAGLFIGLMFATKETFAISMVAWGIPALLLLGQMGRLRQFFPQYGKALLGLSLCAAAVSTLLYTSALKNPSGIVDAFRTYFVYEVTEGHEKPWSYYLELLLKPKETLGLWWSEAAIVVFILLAVIAAIRYEIIRRPLLFLTLGFILHLLIYSMIGYKTPWLMLLPWALACLAAGFTGRLISETKQAPAIAVTGLILFSLTFQIKQSVAGGQKFANDWRNPYAYVPTSKDAPTLGRWLEDLNSIQAEDETLSIALIGSGYWPLPWYLRTFDQVGYWPSAQAELAQYSVIIAMPDQTQQAHTLYGATHVPLPRGLRHNVSATVFLENTLWTDWIERKQD